MGRRGENRPLNTPSGRDTPRIGYASHQISASIGVTKIVYTKIACIQKPLKNNKISIQFYVTVCIQACIQEQHSKIILDKSKN